MAHSIVRTLLASGAATALIAIPTACSFSIGTSHSHSVSKAEVARQITAKMTDAAGNKPESVTCPSDLPGRGRGRAELRNEDQGPHVQCQRHRDQCRR